MKNFKYIGKIAGGIAGIGMVSLGQTLTATDPQHEARLSAHKLFVEIKPFVPRVVAPVIAPAPKPVTETPIEVVAELPATQPQPVLAEEADSPIAIEKVPEPSNTEPSSETPSLADPPKPTTKTKKRKETL